LHILDYSFAYKIRNNIKIPHNIASFQILFSLIFMIYIDNFFHKIIEDLPGAIIIVDKDSIIWGVNNDAVKIFRFEKNELISQKLEILLPARFRQKHQTQVRDFFNLPVKKKHSGELRTVPALRKDGVEILVEINIAPFSTSLNDYAIVSIFDVTDSVERNKKLNEKNVELQLINNELQKFSYTVSHDLKAPLSNIKGLTTLMKSKITHDKGLEDLLKIVMNINKSVEFMGNLINKCLIKAGSQKEDSNEIINTSEVLNEILQIIHVPTNIKITISPLLPKITGRKVEVIQVFLNLITNAIKYNDKEVGFLNISCEDKDNEHLFSFSDNGPGIPEERMNLVFNLFESSDTGSDSHGIGLMTVKSIIERQGGSIWVESTIGEGTTFYFTWPKSIYNLVKQS
jgi:PAS domain S-box-containing protein